MLASLALVREQVAVPSDAVHGGGERILVVLGGFTLPSLTAYQVLFGICAGAAVLGAGIALLVPRPQG